MMPFRTAHVSQRKIQFDEGALWVRIPSTNIISLSPPMIESYRVLEIHYKLPILKIELPTQSSLRSRMPQNLPSCDFAY